MIDFSNGNFDKENFISIINNPINLNKLREDCIIVLP